MKTGLYFGSFNPIHHGHLIIASQMFNLGLVDELWFVISPQNPFKPAAGLLNENHRYHLVQKAIEEDPRFKASNIEFNLPRPSYTVDTLTYLHEKYPGREFCIVMGSDGFSNMDKWKNAATLFKNYEIIVYPRPGHPVENTFGAKVTVATAPYLEISSTFIRNLIKEKKSIQYLVPDAVMEEIERNNYYR